MVDPLEDIKVLELSQMLAGPYVGMNLADLGADVVKIERPGFGEISRHVEPKVGGESYYYLSVNRGKRSVTIDLKSDEGRETFLELAADADVVLENFKPGTAEKLGIGYESVLEINDEIIYCSISGFGQTGPMRDRPAVGHVIQAYSGITSMTRDLDDRPLRVGIPISDLAGAMHAGQSILAAIRRRDQTGTGDHLDVAMSDSMLSFLSIRSGYTHATGEPFPSVSRSHVYFAPEAIYPTADGYLQLSIVTEKQWQSLCESLGREDLAENDAFETVEDRLENKDELNERLEGIFSERSTDHWVDALADAGVPVSRMHDTKTVWEDEHTQTRDMLVDVETPEGEPFSTSAYPVKHDTWSPADEDRDAAGIGEHTAEVLQEHGFAAAEIERLRENGVI